MNIKLLSIILISCLGIIIYSNTFHCSFQFDDGSYIVNNSFIKNIQDLYGIWKYYPCRFITFFSFALNYHFHGLNVFGYHVVNLMVHLASAVLVWWLVLLTLATPAMNGNKITRHAQVIALMAGLVFVSHPVQTEAVTYIWQRTASMAAMFYLASLCFYIKFRLLEDKDSSLIYYFCSLMMAAMAVFTKEFPITLPFMLLFYEFCFLKAKRNFNLRPLVPFFLIVLTIPLSILFSGSGQEKLPLDRVALVPYFLTQFRVLVTYIRLVFIPIHQNLDYDYPIFKSIFELPVLLSILFLSSILYGAARLFSKYRLVSFSIFWFFLTLLPESSVIPFKDVIYEHRLYLPLAGYSIFLVSGVYYLWGTKSIKTMVIILTVIVLCNAVLTYQRNKIWKDKFTLWDDAVGKSPHKARPYGNRGTAYYRQGNFAQALLNFNKAIEINPNYAEVYNNRGSIYNQQGNFIQAMSDFNKSIEVDPNEIAYVNRGAMHEKQGNFTQAMLDFNKAIAIDPTYAEAYSDRGIIYAQQGNTTQAMLDFNKAIAIDPNYTDAYNNRAFLLKLMEQSK